MIPVYITTFNRLAYVQDMVACLVGVPDVEPIIVDNASTYSPLIEWYRDCPVEVIRRDTNGGPRAVWATPAIDFRRTTYYAVTDPDLDLSGVPTDFLAVLCDGLERNRDVMKCGLSLEIDDLPSLPMTARILAWESKFWSDRLDSQFFRADVATTLAVYSAARGYAHYRPALRSDRPYTARHRPWYVTSETATDDDRYYWSHLEHKQTLGWSPRIGRTHGAAR